MPPTPTFAYRRSPPLLPFVLLLCGLAGLLLLFALGCRARRAPSARAKAWAARQVSPAQARAAQQRWRTATRQLASDRSRFAPSERTAARARLDQAIGDELVPTWVGTPWTFSGVAKEPFDGSVACGHFVGALLRGAGMDVSPSLGALPSARIVRTFAGRSRTRWWTDRRPAAVAEAVRKEGDGLYLLGLDTHVGLLRVRGGDVDLCHATGSWPRSVLCEPAASSRSLRSRVHVWGPLLTDDVVDAWIAARPIPLAD